MSRQSAESKARPPKLNHERYAEEVAEGLHDKKKAKGAKKTRKAEAANSSPTLLEEDES